MTNIVVADEGVVGAAMLVATAATFVAALAVPDAFGRHRLLFAVAFLIVRLIWIPLFALAGRGDPDLRSAVLRITPSQLLGAGLILGAAFSPAQNGRRRLSSHCRRSPEPEGKNASPA